jgi:hypothetical protein
MQYNIKILLLLYICLMSNNINAQHLRLEDIPEITLDDFKAKPKSDSPYPAYMSVRTLYRLDSIVEISKDKFRLKVITTVEPLRDDCYFDQTKIPNNAIKSVLKHEKGHLIIGFIGANQIEEELSSQSYSSDYQKEVSEAFNILLKNINILHQRYDKITKHNANTEQQEIWDKALIQMFKDTYSKRQSY